jgi:predicted Zn-dependent protease
MPTPPAIGWTREQAKALADRVLSYSKADECEVSLELSRDSHTRFAANEVTTAGTAVDLMIAITSRGKGKSGTVRLNDTDPEALKAAVARSEELRELSPVDPEFVEGLGPQTYPEIPAWHDETGNAGAAERRPGVAAALTQAREKKMNASGFFETEAHWSAIANKKGNFGFFRSTGASYSTTMRSADGTGSGWAGFASPLLSDIRADDLATRAAKKAATSVSPRSLEPGRMTVILEPQAVEDLLGLAGFALSARAADEGRSFFSKPGGGNRIGEKLFHESVTLRSDPLDPRIPGRPWAGGGGGFGGGGFGGGGGGGGLPARRTTWIEKGVLKDLSVDRVWAAKSGKPPLPFSGSLVMDGGSGSIDDLVAGTTKGVLVTRFWYIRVVNPQTVQATGLTRDGVWLIENGRITAPVNNFRFNESPMNLLANVEALSAPVTTGATVLPAIRSKDFNFSSISDAV